VTAAAATSGVSVFVGYADNLRANPRNFPSPWNGAPNVTFQGCQPKSCVFDASAIRLLNNTPQSVAVGNLAIDVGGCVFKLWQGGTLQPGAELIATQTASAVTPGCATDGSMDTSDVGPNGANWSTNCKPSGLIPKISMTLDGIAQTLTDSTQLVNTGGIDAAACNGPNTPGGPNNESTQWTLIGTPVCTGAMLDFQPPLTQTVPTGAKATVSALLTNSCGTPLKDVVVDFKISNGPNAGQKGQGTTDASGIANFTYSSDAPGTDTIAGLVTVAAIPPPDNTFPSDNTAAVTWVLPTSMSGRAFGSAVNATVPLVKQGVPVQPSADTGQVDSTTTSDTSQQCATTPVGPVTAKALCGQVATITTPDEASATANAAGVSLMLGSPVPVVRLQAAKATSTTSCGSSQGATTIASLSIGNTVITLPDTIPANDKIVTNLAGITLILNEQLSSPGGLTVNAVHLKVNLPPAATVDVVVASATSAIHNC
jgi:hypothetical protein